MKFGFKYQIYSFLCLSEKYLTKKSCIGFEDADYGIVKNAAGNEKLFGKFVVHDSAKLRSTMKKYYLLAFVATTLILTSCKYGHVSLRYPQAPMAYLPEGVDDIAVVNRSLTSNEDTDKRVIESILTGEIGGSDRLASDEALKGVYDGINQENGIHIIVPTDFRLYGTGTREVPAPLNWDTVAKICDSAGADVLLVLENFDSNSDLLIAAATNQVQRALSGQQGGVPVPRTVRVDVRCYWRLYDPVSKTVSDQFQQTYYMTFNLVNGVPPLNALPMTAYNAGLQYIQRYLPSFYVVRREMYKKGKGRNKREFKTGWRKAEVANWESAIETWKPIVENGNRRSAGRAALNIAVAYEVLGDTQEALKWAQRSYEEFGDKLGRSYAKILVRRRNLEGF